MNINVKLKGMSLPIETVIIIAVCILVLIATILFWTEGFNPPAKDILLEKELRIECNNWGRISNYEYNAITYNKEDYPELSKIHDNAKDARKFCSSLE